jgi:tripeptidyl-peptidase-1
MTPTCLQQLYGIPSTLASQSSNKLAVSGYLEQFANLADLRVCAKASSSVPKIKEASTFILQTIDGGENRQAHSEAGVEAVSTVTFH